MPNALLLLQLDLIRTKSLGTNSFCYAMDEYELTLLMHWKLVVFVHWMNAEMPHVASIGSETPPTAMNGCDVCRYRTGCLFLGLTHILMVAAYHKGCPPGMEVAAHLTVGGKKR